MTKPTLTEEQAKIVKDIKRGIRSLVITMQRVESIYDLDLAEDYDLCLLMEYVNEAYYKLEGADEDLANALEELEEESEE